jgi:predicted deacetylase
MNLARLRGLARHAAANPVVPAQADPPVPWPPELCALAIAIGPVTPEAWPRCERLLSRVRTIEPLPVTWLVSPPGGDTSGRTAGWYRRALTDRHRDGDELAWLGDGLAHCDARCRCAALAVPEVVDPQIVAAAGGLAAAAVWFWSQGWPLNGFFPANGSLSEAEWDVLAGGLLSYAVTQAGFHLLGPRVRVSAAQPGLGALAALRRSAGVDHALKFNPAVPLARVLLHPRDVDRPARLRRALALIDELRRACWPMTHAAFAHRLARHVQAQWDAGGMP